MTPIPERRKLLHQLAEHWMYDYVAGLVTADEFARKLYGSMLDECNGVIDDMAEAAKQEGKIGKSVMLAGVVAELEGLRP